MTTEQPSLLTEDDIASELAQARRVLDHWLHQIRDFTEFAQEMPWLHLEDLLRELRAAAVTVAALERVQAVRR